MSGSFRFVPVVVTILLAAGGVDAAAQNTTTQPVPPAQAAGDPDPFLQLDPVEPEFTLGALPTSLRMPSGKFAFRMTHRFARPIASGDAGDFFADLFGFDSAARIGLEVRYGVRPGTQVTFHRTNDRSIQLLGQQRVLTSSALAGLAVDAIGALEGGNNFSEEFGGAVGAIISRRLGGRGVLYVQPVGVFNANPDADANGQSDHTMLLGVGGRLRLGGSRVYLVAEAAPQVAGYDLGVDHVSIGIEKRAGGHMFQFTVANSLGTTLRQVARGGVTSGDWYVGFNLTRRFF
jgi:hypothetical protein